MKPFQCLFRTYSLIKSDVIEPLKMNNAQKSTLFEVSFQNLAESMDAANLYRNLGIGKEESFIPEYYFFGWSPKFLCVLMEKREIFS